MVFRVLILWSKHFGCCVTWRCIYMAWRRGLCWDYPWDWKLFILFVLYEELFCLKNVLIEVCGRRCWSALFFNHTETLLLLFSVPVYCVNARSWLEEIDGNERCENGECTPFDISAGYIKNKNTTQGSDMVDKLDKPKKQINIKKKKVTPLERFYYDKESVSESSWLLQIYY